jgi:hypothetical protein
MPPQQPSNVDRDRAALPKEETVVRRPMRVVTLPPPTQRPYRTAGLKGGKLASGAADGRLAEPEPEAARKGGSRSAFYVIAAKDVDDLETPIFALDTIDGDQAVALFTDEDDALRYINAAGWDKTHEPRPIGPERLTDWLNEARSAGIMYLAINLDPTQTKTDAPQPVLALADVPGTDVAEWLLRQIALVR